MGASESTLKDGEAAPVPSEEAHAFLRKAVQDLNTVAIAAAAPSSRAVQANSRLLERLIDKFIGTSLAAVWQRWCRFCEVDAAKLPVMTLPAPLLAQPAQIEVKPQSYL